MQIAFALVFFVLIAGLIVWLYSLLRTKRFFIVRHGQTLLNAEKIKQGAEGGLSESGKEQAHRVGLFLGQFHIQAICASPYERAKETALIIASLLKVPVSYSPLLRERKNPSDVVGKSTKDPEVERIIGLIDLRFHEDGFRYSDEENFTDLKERARLCAEYLEGQPARRICVVTHHAFLKMLIAYVLYRDSLHADDFLKLSFFNQADNGGVTICEYHPWKQWFSKTRGWEILSYNDQLGS